MRILIVNCGSSSLKLRVADAVDGGLSTLIDGAVSAIGSDASAVTVTSPHGARERATLAVTSWSDAFSELFARFGAEHLREIDAVGHRVVHGGAFNAPVVVDDEVLDAVRAARRFAPLHNGPSLEGLLAARQLLPGVPHVAVFDTTFHSSMLAAAAHYALPRDLSLQLGIRRYGYHGIAHRSMSERYAELRGIALEHVSAITLQLGGGCSAAAVHGRASLDTSMGFTPAEGLMMATRPGDVNPAAIAYIQRERGTSVEELEHMLNHECGLLGVSGISADMATLLEEEARGNARAGAAIEMFCYRVRKYIGAYIAVLGEAQAVIFGGGIGERSPEVRRRICEPLAPLGLEIDQAMNESLVEADGVFSAPHSRIGAWVIRSDEARIIAADTRDVVSRLAGATV